MFICRIVYICNIMHICNVLYIFNLMYIYKIMYKCSRSAGGGGGGSDGADGGGGGFDMGGVIKMIGGIKQAVFYAKLSCPIFFRFDQQIRRSRRRC